MRRPLVLAAVAAVAGSVILASALASAAPPEHVTVCHRTGSQVHPWVTIHPSANGAYRGHLNHPKDVIPPFRFQGSTYSLNWPSEDVRIVNGECHAISAPEPPEVEGTPPIENEPSFTG